MRTFEPEGLSARGMGDTGRPAKSQPVLMIAVGRGRVGKTTILNIFGQYFRKRGSRLALWNVDPHTQSGSLSEFFDNVEEPGFGGLTDRGKWLEAKITEQSEGGYDALVDVGGGDLILSRMANSINLNRVTGKMGIKLVMIHVLGTDPGDLDHFRTNWASKIAGCPTILVLNAGLLDPEASPVAEFRHVLESDVVVKAHEVGARAILLPLLGCMKHVVERRISFDDAGEGVTPAGMSPISPFDQERIFQWWNDEIAPLIDRLPREWLPRIPSAGPAGEVTEEATHG